MAKTVKTWGYHVLIAIDNCLTPAADETLSSRTYRGAVLAKYPRKRWRIWYRVINVLFFNADHCKTAYESEVKRRQYPAEFRDL